ncbi:quinone-dependent dihydroorotate dehydrogenase [Micromonospora phytophila]|uniref:quinone-dependent dihydroorotate dehydrogenase n=1 Tax=Micromonospora phytophila TaxID=709888 RepID=UPI0020306C24|nr:quinone-dependent dihydroorotate dehydrogenase [Micromonospora phytophila]MCM0676810.1 quinone-dependent dihydroorotate dehydrogenase [Micromonospora phytophila]
MIFERALRPALFRIGGGDAEAAHEWTLHRLAGLSRRPAALAALRSRYAVRAPRTVFGVDFPNPVGLAAGMDKDGAALPAWPALGFGFVEVGTVTAHPQPGNPRPRLFRLRDSEAVVNRMGFNNAGAEALAARLAALPGPIGAPLGISLGKSKVTPLDEAVEDYRASYRALREHGDYFAVNVSSPNTPGLRALQDRSHLDALLAALVGEKPVLVKIAPDLTEAAIAELLEVCLARGAAGVIATNTTLARDGLAPADRARGAETGGLSGRPLAARAREVVSFVHRETGGRLPIIGVGGILDPDDAARMFDAGAALVQLYTGFIYRGPALVRAAARATAAAPEPAVGR